MKRTSSANASMGAISKIWDDDNLDTYSKYLLFRPSPEIYFYGDAKAGP